MLEPLKMVSGDLLDIWLYEGTHLEYTKQTRLVSTVYESVDPYVKYLEKYEQIKEKGTIVSSQIQQYKQSV
jgi:type III secretory pathway component EscR